MSLIHTCRKLFRYSDKMKESVKPPIHQNLSRWTMWEQLDHYICSLAKNSQRRYWSVLNEFCLYNKIVKDSEGEKTFQKITLDDAQIYINWCKTRPSQAGRSRLISDQVASSTVKNKATIMYSIFKALIDRQVIDRNPFQVPMAQLRKINAGDRRPTKVTPLDKVNELLALDWGEEPEGLRDRAIIAVLYGGALRRSEAYNLRLLDVQLEGQRVFLTLRHTKKQRSDTQQLPEWSAKIIADYLVQRKKLERATEMQPLFTMYVRNIPTGEFINERTFARIYQRALARVGLTIGYSSHSGRKTAITRALELGTPIEKVSKFARHSSIEMTQRYNGNSDTASSDVADILSYQTTATKK